MTGRTRTWTGLAAWLGITFLAAAVGGRFTPGEWYAALEKPPWTPPGAVFAPVWTFLYASMGVAAWLVWKEAGFAAARLALGVYLAQLVVNAAWSWLFFGLHRIGWALADIGLLLALILLTLLLFRRRNRVAGLLLVPYLLWVGFAAALNLELFRLNG